MQMLQVGCWKSLHNVDPGAKIVPLGSCARRSKCRVEALACIIFRLILVSVMSSWLLGMTCWPVLVSTPQDVTTSSIRDSSINTCTLHAVGLRHPACGNKLDTSPNPSTTHGARRQHWTQTWRPSQPMSGHAATSSCSASGLHFKTASSHCRGNCISLQEYYWCTTTQSVYSKICHVCDHSCSE